MPTLVAESIFNSIIIRSVNDSSWAYASIYFYRICLSWLKSFYLAIASDSAYLDNIYITDLPR